MPENVYAVCHVCGNSHQITVSRTFRLHRNHGSPCPGSGQRPHQAVTPPASRAKTPHVLRLPPVDELTYGRSCDGGNCNAPSVGWRWYRDLKEWLPVCGIHMAGPPGPTRVFDPDD